MPNIPATRPITPTSSDDPIDEIILYIIYLFSAMTARNTICLSSLARRRTRAHTTVRGAQYATAGSARARSAAGCGGGAGGDWRAVRGRRARRRRAAGQHGMRRRRHMGVTPERPARRRALNSRGRLMARAARHTAPAAAWARPPSAWLARRTRLTAAMCTGSGGGHTARRPYSRSSCPCLRW